MKRARRELLRDIKWGIGWGLWLASGFSVIVVVLAGFRGSTDYPELGLTTPRIIALYYLLALIGGSVVGILRPFTKSKLGGFVVGSIIGTLVYGGAGFAIKDVEWQFMVPAAVILGLAVGGTAGYQTVKTERSKRDAA